MLLGLLATGSKAGLIDLLIVVSISLFLLMLMNRPLVAFFGLFSIVVISMVMFAINSQIGFMDTLLARLNELNTGDANTAMTGRAGIWAYTFSLLGAGWNCITGVGVGLFKPLMIANLGGGNLAHNTFLSFFVECGIMTALLVFLVVVSRLFSTLRCLFSTKQFEFLAMFACLLSVFVYMNSVNLQNNRMSYVFLVFVSFALFETSKRLRCADLPTDLTD